MKFYKDKLFLKSMLSIAIPISLQNLITSSLNMVDTLMTSSLGQSSIAAVGLANQIFFFYILIIFGISTGSSVFISQYWGKKDIYNIRKVLGLAIFISTLVGIIFTMSAVFFPEFLMKIFINIPETVRLGSEYLRIVAFSYIITAISFVISIGLRSTGNANIPLKISIVSFSSNTIFNYIFMFGKLGLPALGVKGAAIGTLLARIIEISLLLYAVYSSRGPLAGTVKELFGWNKEFVNKYLKTTSPVILNEGFWALGQVMYSIAYAKIGEEATAAIQVVTTIQNVFFVIFRGLANSSSVMIGNKIGQGEEKEAYDYAINFLIISSLLGIIFGFIMIVSSDLTLKLFRNLDIGLQDTAKSIMLVMGLVFFIKTFNATVIVGVLRGGGDTTFSMFLEIGSVWLIGVPMAFVGALILKLPVYFVVALVSVEEIVKAIISIPRVMSKKWIKNVT
ncbi:putative MATE family efflux protein [Sedimentibacter acidaminivorans]|uniref:MATE family efflux protein n=1 Tax=Sedimentibacter acidaminivorans TaxID=913099 RepID=A0ABS4GHR5_9FIRM|nr:MATE family efflux transporter [Sedimentibacter acidaminivorans]MBP1927226.1 putative MATE family efflux protein [Sedimentibacter acidaminivorans]